MWWCVEHNSIAHLKFCRVILIGAEQAENGVNKKNMIFFFCFSISKEQRLKALFPTSNCILNTFVKFKRQPGSMGSRVLG